MKVLAFIILFFVSINAQAKWVVFVHDSNPIQEISKDKIKRIFLKQQLFWEDGKKIIPLSLLESDKDFDAFAKEFLELDRTSYKGFWIEQKFVSKQVKPKAVQRQLITKIAKVFKGAIGIIPKYLWEKSVKDSLRPVNIKTSK